MKDSWQEKCRRVVLSELANRRWDLADSDELPKCVCREFGGSEPSIDAIKRSTINCYCRILYEACSEKDSHRERQAFLELWRYLYPIALYQTHDRSQAEDATQQALFKTWKHLERCKEPGSFLAYATSILNNVIRDSYGDTYQSKNDSNRAIYSKNEVTLTEMRRTDSEKDVEAGSSENDPGTMDWTHLFADKMKAAWYPIIKKCIKKLLHRAVIIELFFDHKGYKEISQDLGVSVGNVFVCRNRGLRSLHDCDAFWRFFEERLS